MSRTALLMASTISTTPGFGISAGMKEYDHDLEETRRSLAVLSADRL
jgi:hypothetical protein